jgi:hypothetical protein
MNLGVNLATQEMVGQLAETGEAVGEYERQRESEHRGDEKNRGE